jgi:hypothetical protein
LTDGDRASTETPDFEVLWSHRSFGRNLLLLVVVLLLYVQLALFASSFLKVIGLVGAIVFAVALIYIGVSGLRQLRRWPAAATLTQSGVTFYRQAPAAWETLREVRLGKVKPQWLFAVRPLHYVAFLPKDSSSLPRKLRYKLAIRLYGTSLVLMTQTVKPSGEEILAAVNSFSDIDIDR